MVEGREGRKLSRRTSARKALLSNLALSLFEYGRITTTEPKAKELRRFAERIITKAKRGGLHNIRQVAKKIKRKNVLKKIFSEIAPKYQNRQGGYTRILKLQRRTGDGARKVIIELVE